MVAGLQSIRAPDFFLEKSESFSAVHHLRRTILKPLIFVATFSCITIQSKGYCHPNPEPLERLHFFNYDPRQVLIPDEFGGSCRRATITKGGGNPNTTNGYDQWLRDGEDADRAREKKQRIAAKRFCFPGGYRFMEGSTGTFLTGSGERVYPIAPGPCNICCKQEYHKIGTGKPDLFGIFLENGDFTDPNALLMGTVHTLAISALDPRLVTKIQMLTRRVFTESFEGGCISQFTIDNYVLNPQFIEIWERLPVNYHFKLKKFAEGLPQFKACRDIRVLNPWYLILVDMKLRIQSCLDPHKQYESQVIT